MHSPLGIEPVNCFPIHGLPRWRRGRRRAVEGGPAFATAIHAPYPVMAGLVPATHAAPSRTGLRTATARPENPRRHGPAWVPGTSPGMTVEGVEESGRGRACFRDGDPYPLSRHGRACPGHPRRTEPHRAPDGYGPIREPAAARAGVGARDKPGHDCGEGGGKRSREGLLARRRSMPPIPSWPGLSRPPTPHRAAPGSGRLRPDPRIRRRRAGVGARDKPGHDCGEGGGKRSREGLLARRRSIPPIPSWPGLSRPPTPHRAAPGSGRLRPNPRTRGGTGRRGCPGQARA